MAIQGQNTDQRVDQQTTLLRSTIQTLNKISDENIHLHEQTELQFQVVAENINSLHQDYENLWINLELQFQLDNLLMFISLTLTAFHDKQKQFLEALSLGPKGPSHTPIILPPALFMHELEKIREIISGKELDLPLPINKDTIAYFYQISTTRSRILGDQLLVSMSIPIVGLHEFELLKVTSFPHKLHNELYNFILPAHEYIAIDNFREKFISFSNQELENCHDLRQQSSKAELICLQLSPTIDITSSRDDCAITILTKNSQPQNCDIRISNMTSEVWLKLRQPNAWLTVFPKRQLIYIRCNNLPTVEKLIEGSGIFTIQPDCQIKTNHILIQGHNTYQSELYPEVRPLLTYNFNFNDTLDKLTFTHQTEINKVDSPNVISFGEIDKLKKLSTSITDLQRLAHTTQLDQTRPVYRPFPKETNYWAFSFFIFVLMTSYALVICLYQQYKELVDGPTTYEFPTKHYKSSEHIDNLPEMHETTV